MVVIRFINISYFDIFTLYCSKLEHIKLIKVTVKTFIMWKSWYFKESWKIKSKSTQHWW